MKYLVTVLCCWQFVLCAAAFASYLSFTLTGTWPKSWGKELEPLRKQATTYVHADAGSLHYAIPFTKGAEFEAALPHLLKLRTKGSPIFIMRAPTFFLDKSKAGVIVNCPASHHAEHPAEWQVPMSGVENLRQRWSNGTYLEVVVDGTIVNVDNVRFPADAQIVDERKAEEKK